MFASSGASVDSSSATVLVTVAALENFLSGFACIDLNVIACNNMRLR